MVTDRLHCRKDDDEQVPTRPVSARWIMSQPAFALGAADARVGRGTHRDYDLWDTNGQWNAGEPGPRSHRGVSNCDVPGRSPQKPWPGSSPSAKTSSDNHHENLVMSAKNPVGDNDKATAVVADDWEDTLKRVGGSQSDDWNHVLGNQAIQSL
jgi:hypothetical protein